MVTEQDIVDRYNALNLQTDPTNEEDLIVSAGCFMMCAHRSVNHVCRGSGKPYEYHPIEVMALTGEVTGSYMLMIAALLHDVVEDTPVTIETINEVWGEDIGFLIHWLTDVSRPEDGNRALRKSLDREHFLKCMDHPHFLKASHDTLMVKLADIISNALRISEYEPSFLPQYLLEMGQLLESIDKSKYYRCSYTYYMILEMVHKGEVTDDVRRYAADTSKYQHLIDKMHA